MINKKHRGIVLGRNSELDTAVIIFVLNKYFCAEQIYVCLENREFGFEMLNLFSTMKQGILLGKQSNDLDTAVKT